MTVFVDDMKAPFRSLLMCHMVADSDAELHAMADAIGVARQWHQAPPKHDSHYDLAQSKRALAVKLGAVEVTLRQCAAMNIRRRVTGSLGEPDDAWQWLKQHMADRRVAAAAKQGAIS